MAASTPKTPWISYPWRRERNRLPDGLPCEDHRQYLAPLLPGLTEARALLESWQSQGFRTGLTSGSFDVLHVEHLRYLARVRCECDRLMVGLDSDEKIRDVKGPHRPYLTQEERAAMLAHIRHVDALVVKPYPAEHWSFIRLLSPDALGVSEVTYGEESLRRLRTLCSRVIVIPWTDTEQSDASRLQKLRSRLKVD